MALFQIRERRTNAEWLITSGNNTFDKHFHVFHFSTLFFLFFGFLFETNGKQMWHTPAESGELKILFLITSQFDSRDLLSSNAAACCCLEQ